jgi:hypothetical protein
VQRHKTPVLSVPSIVPLSSAVRSNLLDGQLGFDLAPVSGLVILLQMAIPNISFQVNRDTDSAWGG